jgi:hypothetical protein
MAGTGSGFGWTSAGRRLIGKTVLWLTGSCAATFVSMEIARWTQAALRTWLIATMGTVFLSTVVGAQAPVRGDSSSQRTEIIKVADTYRMAILSGDAQRAAAVYADDGAELPPPTAGARSGRNRGTPSWTFRRRESHRVHLLAPRHDRRRECRV